VLQSPAPVKAARPPLLKPPGDAGYGYGNKWIFLARRVAAKAARCFASVKAARLFLKPLVFIDAARFA
jgi:hypothetical protein